MKPVVRVDHEKPEIYFEPDDWWIGYYRGGSHHYVCIIPTIVIKWQRAHRSWGWGKDGNQKVKCMCLVGHDHGVVATLIAFDGEELKAAAKPVYTDPRSQVAGSDG